MRLKATIQQQEVLVLIDSGRSGTFINNTVVQQLGLPVTAAPLTHVTVADGGKLTSEGVVENLQWWTQGHCFTNTTKILQLGYYDMILGMDWLEQFSPMWVHWQHKRMRFNYQGARITLTGVKDCTSTCLPLQTKKLKGLIRKGGVAQLIQLCNLAEDTEPQHPRLLLKPYFSSMLIYFKSPALYHRSDRLTMPSH
jgi:hypothetical protein